MKVRKEVKHKAREHFDGKNYHKARE